VLLGGLESTKEESYLFENLLLSRGIGTFAFDGPGQGEMLDEVTLAEDFDRYTSTVLDFLIERDGLDPGRFGVLGRSLGGHYALRSASRDQRFAACVSWGGFVSVEWSYEPLHDRASWRYVTKKGTEEEAREYVERSLDIGHLLKDLSCPTYVLHGALDEVPLDQIELIRRRAVNADLTIVVEPHGDHCCHNLGPTPRVRMADWLADQLR
jgi:2,6-dihydroxypseudooxynicotine hydrolase